MIPNIFYYHNGKRIVPSCSISLATRYNFLLFWLWSVNVLANINRPEARCIPRLVATGRVSCVCDWLRDATGLDFRDRSWICNSALVNVYEQLAAAVCGVYGEATVIIVMSQRVTVWLWNYSGKSRLVWNWKYATMPSPQTALSSNAVLIATFSRFFSKEYRYMLCSLHWCLCYLC